MLEAMVDTPNFLEKVLDLSVNSPFPSIRGTCCHVLGLISRCPAARLQLARGGWCTPMRQCPTVVVPTDRKQFFTVSTLKFEGSVAQLGKDDSTSPTDLSFATYGLAPPLAPFNPEWKTLFKNIKHK